MSTQASSKGPSKAKTAANALLLAFSLAAGLVALNIVAGRLFFRVDLTEDKIYGLSQVSRDTVKNLPDRMTAKAFISSGLQPPLNKYGQYVRDLLDEYAAASGGKFQWEAIDPLAPGKDAEETRTRREEIKSKYKIQPITLQSLSESKLEIGSDNYLGVAFVFGEEIQSIPQIASTEGLEYQLTSMLRKMTASNKHRKVGFVTSEGELSPSQGLQYVGRVLHDYETTTVQLDKPVPDEIDVLVAVGPRQPFGDKAKFYLDQYLMKGKPVGLFIDGMIIEAPNQMQMQVPGMDTPRIGRANEHNLGDLLEKYGLKLNEDLILDEQNVAGPVPVQGQLFLANYPTFIGVGEKGFTPKFSLTDHIDAMVLPFASSIDLVGDLKDGKAEGLKATPIAKTTPEHSWRHSGFFVFNPQARLEKSKELGPFALGYALEGKLKSAYPNGPVGEAASDASGALRETQDTRLLVVGSSALLNDQNLPVQHVPLYRNNLLFFLNAVDWLAHDDSLIALRSKGMGSRPLQIPPDSRSALWRYVCELGIPIAVVLIGIILFSLRTARRRAISL